MDNGAAALAHFKVEQNQRYQRNLEFFSQKYPAIYDYFVRYSFTESQFVFDPTSFALDLNENGKPLYNVDAHIYCKDEVTKILSQCGKGSKIETVPTYNPSNFKFERLFCAKAHALVQYCPFPVGEKSSYQLDDFYPMIVFMGVGLGYHIEELLAQKDIHQAVIVETKFDRFLASLYCIDWAKIGERFDAKSGRMLSFVLMADEGGGLVAELWNQLQFHRPIFPLMTLFYNHRNETHYKSVVGKINQDLVRACSTFGNYDDEIIQINHILHNAHQQIPGLPFARVPESQFPKNKYFGKVIIVGSGPSLNERIDDLKKMQSVATIISAGTALKIFYAHGIKPDIHIEVESDFLTHKALQYIDDKDWLASIKFVGPAQISPLVFNLFKDKALFFKDLGAGAAMFGQFAPQLPRISSTVVNGAFALAAYYSAAEIYLFGVDFGFVSKDKHHASGSLYDEVAAERLSQNYPESGEENLYEESKLLKILKNNIAFNNEELYGVKSVAGEDIYTSQSMFIARINMEDHIKYFRADGGRVFNCSLGVAIEGAEQFSSEQIAWLKERETARAEHRLEHILFEHLQCGIDILQLQDILHQSSEQLCQIVIELQGLLNQPVKNLSDISLLCGKIIYALDSGQRTNNLGMSLIWGSVNHLMYILYSFSFADIDDAAKIRFYEIWKNTTADFLIEVVPHYQSVTFKHFSIDTDPWLYKTL